MYALHASGGPITETETISVAKYLEQNGTGFLGFAVPEQAAFFGAKSLFAAKDLATHCEREPCKVHAGSLHPRPGVGVNVCRTYNSQLACDQQTCRSGWDAAESHACSCRRACTAPDLPLRRSPLTVRGRLMLSQDPRFGGKKVLNHEDVQAQIEGWIARGACYTHSWCACLRNAPIGKLCR